MAELHDNPERNVTTVDIDLELSTLNPIHGKLMGSIYEYFKSTEGMETIMNGRKAAGISEAIADARSSIGSLLNPYSLTETL